MRRLVLARNNVALDNMTKHEPRARDALNKMTAEVGMNDYKFDRVSFLYHLPTCPAPWLPSYAHDREGDLQHQLALFTKKRYVLWSEVQVSRVSVFSGQLISQGVNGDCITYLDLLSLMI